MQQKINFYTLLPKHHVAFLSAKRLFVIYIFIIFILIINSIYIAGRNYKKSNELVKLQKQLNVEKNNLNKLIKNNPLINPKDLIGSLNQLQKVFETTDRMLAFLSSNYSFYDLFKAFATTNSPNVWLTEITIADQGAIIGIHGRALQASALNQFLTQLNSQPVFRMQPFQLQELRRAMLEKNQHIEYLNFYIATTSLSKITS